jgi:hypothetical protein
LTADGETKMMISASSRRGDAEVTVPARLDPDNREDDPPRTGPGRPPSPDDVATGDLLLIDEMLARSPEERLACLEATLASLEALIVTTGSTASAQ